MKVVQKLWKVAGLPCWECGGKGYVVDADVARFIRKNGLALYQASEALMANEITYGGLGSIPIGAWEELGLSEDQAMEFATEVGYVHAFHACRVCKGQENHPWPLKTATDVINSLRANDRRRYAEREAKRTPKDIRNRRLSRMAVAIRYAQQTDAIDLGAAE
jgi:hypothetical protein